MRWNNHGCFFEASILAQHEYANELQGGIRFLFTPSDNLTTCVGCVLVPRVSHLPWLFPRTFGRGSGEAGRQFPGSSPSVEAVSFQTEITFQILSGAYLLYCGHTQIHLLRPAHVTGDKGGHVVCVFTQAQEQHAAEDCVKLTWLPWLSSVGRAWFIYLFFWNIECLSAGLLSNTQSWWFLGVVESKHSVKCLHVGQQIQSNLLHQLSRGCWWLMTHRVRTQNLVTSSL